MSILSGKTILVTGASSGIGQAIAVRISKEGGKAILLGRNEERLKKTASLCSSETVVFSADIGQHNSLDSLPDIVRTLAKEHGPLAGLVHSAGIYQIIPLRALYAEEIVDTFMINAVSGVLLAKGLTAKNTCTENASIVFISSVMGHVGQSGVVAYCMSKGAVEQAVKSLALELGKQGIRVNAVSPSIIATPMIEEQLAKMTEQEKSNYLSTVPGGLGQPDDVASAVAFLLSDAARFITGISLPVDNGFLAQ